MQFFRLTIATLDLANVKRMAVSVWNIHRQKWLNIQRLTLTDIYTCMIITINFWQYKTVMTLFLVTLLDQFIVCFCFFHSVKLTYIEYYSRTYQPSNNSVNGSKKLKNTPHVFYATVQSVVTEQKCYPI